MSTVFYNPKIAAMGLGVSIVSNSIQLDIAKAINPNAGGRPQAGQRVYDWEQKAYFGITVDECYNIDKAIPSLLNGTYKDPKATDSKYEDRFSITHFRNNQPSRLTLQRAVDSSNKPLNSCTISLAPPGGGQNFFYPMRPYEFAIFGWMIRNGYQRLPFESAFLEAIGKKKRKDEFDQKNKQNDNGNGNRQNNSYQNNQNQNNQNQNNQNNNAQGAQQFDESTQTNDGNESVQLSQTGGDTGSSETTDFDF